MTPSAADTTAIVILAAGKGTRMKSEKAKVLHALDGRAMILHVVACAAAVAPPHNIVVVVGHQAQTVSRTVSRSFPDVRFATQRQQLGTGHAVSCALPCLDPQVQRVVVLCGDVPLLSDDTVRRLVADHESARRVLSVLAVEVADPAGYGRILLNDQHRVEGIVEEVDATEEQRRIRTINAGIYCVERGFLTQALGLLRNDNAQGEYYLTDIVGIGRRQDRNVGAFVWRDSEEVMGVNTLEELHVAEMRLRDRLGKTA